MRKTALNDFEVILYQIVSIALSIFSFISLTISLFALIKGENTKALTFIFLQLIVVIYIIFSFKFLRTINQKLSLDLDVKNWIQVSGYISFGSCIYLFSVEVEFLAKDSFLNFSGIGILILIYTILLFLHIIFNLVSIYRYNKLSKDKTKEDEDIT